VAEKVRVPAGYQLVWSGQYESMERRAVARVTQLRPLLAPILREEGVPDEIAALVLVESGGQPTALSPKGHWVSGS